MERALIVPAAGAGSRLGLGVPKLLAPLNGRPMIAHLLTLYTGVVERAAVIVHPAAVERMQEIARAAPMPVEVFLQERPTGMLDAILLARPAVERWRPRRVWITWCDQVAIHPDTVARLKSVAAGGSEPLLAMPTCRSGDPYVHLLRDANGDIVGVLHRREGDVMPAVGEGDVGLFDLSLHAYLDLLPQYAASPAIGRRTGERNFVPFVAIARQHGAVLTFPCVESIEAVGVNTQDDLAKVEAHLRTRGGASRA